MDGTCSQHKVADPLGRKRTMRRWAVQIVIIQPGLYLMLRRQQYEYTRKINLARTDYKMQEPPLGNGNTKVQGSTG